MTELTSADAAQTPLTELLRSVPRDARLAIDDGPYSTTYHPIGNLCHAAADEIDRLRATPPAATAACASLSDVPVIPTIGD